MKNKSPQALICSFCGKSMDEVERMVTSAGPIHMCCECVEASPDWAITASKAVVCALCGQYVPKGNRVIRRQSKTICDDCMKQIKKVLEEDAAQRNR